MDYVVDQFYVKYINGRENPQGLPQFKKIRTTAAAVAESIILVNETPYNNF